MNARRAAATTALLAAALAAGAPASAAPPGAATRRAEAALRWALAKVGTHEVGTSNCGPAVSAWQRRTGMRPCQPWCQAFVHEAYLRAGIDVTHGIARPGRFLALARRGRGGLRYLPEARIRRGDIVLMSWDGRHVTHLALATSSYRVGSHRVETVEGNTAHAVRRKARSLRWVVAGVRVTASAARSG